MSRPARLGGPVAQRRAEAVRSMKYLRFGSQVTASRWISLCSDSIRAFCSRPWRRPGGGRRPGRGRRFPQEPDGEASAPGARARTRWLMSRDALVSMRRARLMANSAQNRPALSASPGADAALPKRIVRQRGVALDGDRAARARRRGWHEERDRRRAQGEPAFEQAPELASVVASGPRSTLSPDASSAILIRAYSLAVRFVSQNLTLVEWRARGQDPGKRARAAFALLRQLPAQVAMGCQHAQRLGAEQDDACERGRNTGVTGVVSTCVRNSLRGQRRCRCRGLPASPSKGDDGPPMCPIGKKPG